MGTEKRERQKANRAQRQQEVQRQQSRKRSYRVAALVVAGVIAVIAFVWIASEIVGEDEPSTPVTVPVVTDAPLSTDPVTSDG